MPDSAPVSCVPGGRTYILRDRLNGYLYMMPIYSNSGRGTNELALNAGCYQTTMTLRRGNKSHKVCNNNNIVLLLNLFQVPNVKLRPAQPSSSSTSTVSKLRAQCDSWVQDSDETNQPKTQSGVDLCPRPFKNVVVCATGVVDKVSEQLCAIDTHFHVLNCIYSSLRCLSKP